MHVIEHGGTETRVVEAFVASDIGAPFEVVLNNAVEATFDKATGERISYVIPDLEGLLVVVAFSRIMHERKLTGADIKFLRKALGLKQRDLAAKIEVAPETLSRIEAGHLPLSPGNEKLLRICALRAAIKLDKLKPSDAKNMLQVAIDRFFDVLKPRAVYDVSEKLVFQFHRAPRGNEGDDTTTWEDRDKLEAA